MALGPGEKAVTARIRGEVQGVWFRSWTVEEATRRALRGWVRNRRDGSVEALFAGPAAAVDEMVAACRDGPPAARVAEVAATPADETPPPGFRQLPTV